MWLWHSLVRKHTPAYVKVIKSKGGTELLPVTIHSSHALFSHYSPFQYGPDQPSLLALPLCWCIALNDCHLLVFCVESAEDCPQYITLFANPVFACFHLPWQ